jgi:indolepyruvate decarboxylase
MPLGDFVVTYLMRAGVHCIFGLPGDLVLNLFYKFATRRGLRIVTLSHEPGVGFAADAFARGTGTMGVMVVTYGAGGHNVVNPVAGSFAEEVPLLVISGGPGEQEVRLGTLIHHQAKEVESQHRIFQEVTCSTRVIQRVDRAAEEIHELVTAVRTQRRPGYLEIHRDIVDRTISVPKAVRDWDGSIPEPSFDRARVAEAARETAARLRSARRPLVRVGIEVHRERAGRLVRRLAERLGAPVVTTVLAKGAFPMDHPLYMGVHMGEFSCGPIRRRARQADLVLELGTLVTDINLGVRAPERPERRIRVASRTAQISRHAYPDVALRPFLSALLAEPSLGRRAPERVRYADNLVRPRRPGRAPLLVNDLLWTVNEFLAARRNYHVFAESGDMLFGGLEVRVPAGGLYFAQGFYASMGFAVPGALGAQIGTGKRPLVLCGDGAFQMTGIEIAHAPRHGCNPIVIVVDNGGWGIFRPVSPRADLLELPAWPYAEMATGWGGLGLVARTAAELRAALERAHRDRRFALIQAIVDPNDLSPISRRYIRASAAQGRRERH